ncbi:MAG: ABC transporter ATP-binding protein [Anaerolineae bacterium]|nr:ABC transporter ATP-binding protein [Anaerolineae bacterium]
METQINKDDKILEVHNLKTYFFTEDGIVKAVDGVDFDVNRGEIVALVGESGCGKSVTSLSVMRLVGIPGQIMEGEILFNKQDLLRFSEHEMRLMRGDRISMIFQQPTSCLNPVFRVGDQISEVLAIHRGMDAKVGWRKAVELLQMVGIPEPEKRVYAFPHELSGGMAQRVMIAMALACEPELLIADEPTTALDVTIQAQILDLMRDLQQKLGSSIILITHDMGIVAEMASRVSVMYAGRVVEHSDVNTIFEEPLHPYTHGLLASIPIMGVVRERLETIPGSVPNLIDLPPGCKFAPRCLACVEKGLSMCVEKEPNLIEYKPGHWVRCWLYQQH